MASSRTMLFVGITWCIVIGILYMLTFIGGMYWSIWNEIILKFPVPASVAPYIGWGYAAPQIMTYFIILACGVAATYKIVQTVAEEAVFESEYR